MAGVSGSGKTTLAQLISERLDIPYVELDALHHGPEWTPRPEFLGDVRALVARPTWVCEFQYTAAKPLILERVDVVVWLDVPTAVTMWQVIRRTLIRRVLRTELWNGNVEPPLRSIFASKAHTSRPVIGSSAIALPNGVPIYSSPSAWIGVTSNAGGRPPRGSAVVGSPVR